MMEPYCHGCLVSQSVWHSLVEYLSLGHLRKRYLSSCWRKAVFFVPAIDVIYVLAIAIVIIPAITVIIAFAIAVMIVFAIAVIIAFSCWTYSTIYFCLIEVYPIMLVL